MEQKGVYIVETTHPLPQPVTRHGKKATLRVRARAKMFRGQRAFGAKCLALALMEASAEVVRLRRALDAAEALMEELS